MKFNIAYQLDVFVTFYSTVYRVSESHNNVGGAGMSYGSACDMREINATLQSLLRLASLLCDPPNQPWE